MKRKKIIAVGFILCIFIVLVLLGKNIYDNNVDKPIEGRTEKNQLLLNGIGVFSEKYDGYLESKEIITILENITKQDLPELYKDINRYNDSKLEKYYKKNESMIKDKFGKTNIDEFKEFAKKLQKVTVKLNDWYSLKIDKDSFVEDSDKKSYVYVEYDVKFENGEIQRFSIYISKIRAQNPSYIVDIK